MKILPINNPEVLEITYLQKVKVRSQIIYTILLCSIIIALGVLPLIHVDVSIKSAGILQTPIERNDIIIPVNGRINYLNIKENQKVTKGDTLLHIDAQGLTEQNRLAGNRINELEKLLNDVQQLSNVDATLNTSPKLQTPRYVAAWQQYQRQLRNASITKNQSRRAFERFKQLHDQKVVSDAEYEEHLTEKDQAIAEYDYIESQHKSQWQTDATGYRAELSQLYRDQSNWRNEESFYTLLAPLDGNIQNLIGLQTGTPVFANQKIAELTPDSSLIAMMYINPADIGLVRIGQDVRFQVDAFNYNQWGMLGGKVLDIAEDMVLDANKNPVFKVICGLANNQMQLPNGYIGKLKKGMTMQGRFMVTKRSLYQLLYDKIDNWMNPNLMSRAVIKQDQ